MADAVRSSNNAGKRGRLQLLSRPGSKVISWFLAAMTRPGCIGEFEIIDDHRAGKISVNLIGRLNECGVISPRSDVQLKDLETWQNNVPVPSVWFHCPHKLSWHHGLSRSKMKTHRRENSGILFLGM